MRIDFIAPCGMTIEIEEYPDYPDSLKTKVKKHLLKVGALCFIIKCPTIEKMCTYLSYLGFYEFTDDEIARARTRDK